MKRYELAVFDTLTNRNHYLDFVGRIGRVSNEFSVGNKAYTTMTMITPPFQPSTVIPSRVKQVSSSSR